MSGGHTVTITPSHAHVDASPGGVPVVAIPDSEGWSDVASSPGSAAASGSLEAVVV